VVRDKFAGGDQDYLRTVQYKDATRLTARADLHLKYSTATQPWFAWVFDQIEWPAGSDVLEVGCGPGWMWGEETAEVARGVRLTLTDLTPGMVEAARERVLSLGRPLLVDALVADAQELPFADDSFDIAMANHMLYHVPDPSRALGELARVLRPGGVVLATANGPRHLHELWEVRAGVFGGETVSPLVTAFGSETGLPLVEEQFSGTEWRAFEDELRCTVADDVLAFLTSAPPAESATPDQLAAMRADIVRRLEAGGGLFRVAKESGAFVAYR
jgi:ubiquinone/menaquinone biosynthesis C-methylase UbiE